MLEFKKPKIRLGETFSTGYYFKGEFLSRYKNEAIAILRKRVVDLPDEERNKTDEWKVIHEEYLKTKERTRKIELKKKPYYEKLSKRARKRRIVRLKNKIKDIESRKKDIVKILDKKIKLIEKEIEKCQK